MLKKITILFILLLTIAVKGQEERYTIKNLKINNSYSNFGTTFYGEDKVVYASPRKKSYIIRNVWKGNNQPFLDLYIGDIAEDGELLNVKKFSSKLNTRYHEADVAFTKDMKTVYFSRNNYLEKEYKVDSTGINLIQLYRAKVSENGEWVNIEAMPFNSDQYQTGHPTLSADEKTLYFISDMPGTLGKTDVFKASIDTDGTIGAPINLGPKINTPEREMFSSISGNDELYFSSDGREGGLGGLDIYVSKITNNNLTAPLNLGKPLNSEYDDFSFILNYETRRGYFSSNRKGGHGDDDIYTFNQEIPIVFECKQLVKGTVTEKNTGFNLPGALVVLYNNEDIEIDRTIVGDDAKYVFEVDCNNSYKLIGSKESYSTDTKEFFSTEGKAIEIPLILDKDEFIVERGKCLIKINPIYFDFDKSDIRPDAEIELQKVIDVMKKYPELIIEGGSHTDSRGTYKYNVGLSSRRAKSTVQYIIEHGIDPSKISSKGYGETQLVNACSDGARCSEEAHQFNRRTEFLIVNYDDIKNKYPGICAIKSTSTKEQLEDGITIRVDKKEKEIKNREFEERGSKLLIKLNPIYFDINSSYFRADAAKELNKVVEVMLKYPNLIIECGSHTDSRASDKYNNWLSDRRAKRTIEYIIFNGISPSRITAKGYGETQLINKCANGVKCTNYEHELNRRIEFAILNPEVVNE